MKITIDIDCTPQEARTFLGLPNVEPMQDALVAKMQERLETYIESADPETLMSVWLPTGPKGLGQLQERFWSEVLSGFTGGGQEGGEGERKGKGRRTKDDQDDGKR